MHAGISILDNGGIRFSLAAPTARSVKISFDGADSSDIKYPLTSDGNGEWSLQLFDIPKGVYILHWFVDDKNEVFADLPRKWIDGLEVNYIKIG